MPLKLLKHKSYHVAKEENIARVRRDEQHARESEINQKNQQKAFQRASKIEQLRKTRGIIPSSDSGLDSHLSQDPETSTKQDSTTSGTTSEIGLINIASNNSNSCSTFYNEFIKPKDTQFLHASTNSFKYPTSFEKPIPFQPNKGKGQIKKEPRRVRDPKILDELVKRELDPLNLILTGVQKTQQFERKEKRKRDYQTIHKVGTKKDCKKKKKETSNNTNVWGIRIGIKLKEIIELSSMIFLLRN